MSEITESHVFLFPGQGAQAVGMGRGLVETSGRARRVFDRGREILGWDVLDLCLNGPEEELNSTRVSQPAIFLLSMAVLDALSERLDAPEPLGRSLPAAGTAGLSLGEYSALVFAGSLAFEEALAVVAARGRCMQEACDEAPGGMTSLIGLEVKRVEEAVEAARANGRIGIANYNSPDQTVISGDLRAVEAAAEIAREMGCRRAVPLRVAGAYHSPLMASATRKLTPLLEGLSIAPPRCPFLANVSGGPVEDPEEIRRGLIRQVEDSVRWDSVVRRLVEGGSEKALEVGPGTVLRGLARNIDRRLRVRCVCDSDSIGELCAAGEGVS